MKKLSGFIAEFDHQTILDQDLTNVSVVRTELIELTAKYNQLNLVEILVSGYDDDPRSLYEVVEVRAWMQAIHQQWPDWLFWLTPASLWACMLSLNPEMHSRDGEGQLRVQLDTDRLIKQFQKSGEAAAMILLNADMNPDNFEGLFQAALETFTDMTQRVQLGEYVVIHPDSNEIVTYNNARG